MRFISAVFLALGMAQSASALAPAAAGPEVVTALRALVESGGTITSEAALAQATGNQAIGALFPTVSNLYQSMQKSGKVSQVTDWDALAAKSKTMTSSQTVAALNSLVKSGKAVTQQNALAALSVPAARTAAKPTLSREAAQANASSAYTNFICPTGATQCQSLVTSLEQAKAGKGSIPVSEAEQIAQQFGLYIQLIKANARNCGAAGDQCVTNLIDGAAGMLRTFGTRVNQPFMEAAITSGKTEKSDFTQFANNNGAIAEGLKNASLLGEGMGSDLVTCVTQGGLN